MSSTAQRGEVVVDGSRLGEQDIAHSEHAATVLRLRRLGVIGLLAWTLFGLVDVFVLAFVYPGRWWVYLLARLAGMLVLGLATLRVFAKARPSMRQLRRIDLLVFSATSFLISITCLEAGGIGSSLVLGVITVLVARGALLADHWRRALLPVSLVVLVHPLTLVGLALFSPSIATQFVDLASLGVFALNQLFLLGAAVLTLAGGHSVWSLQRKVFEARSLGRYRLIRRIGKGGMGEVWAAHHRTLGRKVAVKILRSDKVGPQAVARFEREVQATAELTHPNTVRVFDFGATEDGLFYYAMELLSGRDLGALLEREGALAPRRAVRLLKQAAQALAEAHARGIVHRDIKPANLFVSEVAGSGELLKVVDFGLARLRASDEVELTREGFAVGTPSYIAPETLRGEQADSRSDVYALGCVLYHTLAGRPPFAGKELLEIAQGHLNQVPPPLPSTVPQALQQLVMRCLAKDPGRRFRHAAGLAAALAMLRFASSSHRRPTRAAAPAPSRRRQARRPAPEAAELPPILRRRSVEPAMVASGTIDSAGRPSAPSAGAKVVRFRPPIPGVRGPTPGDDRREGAPIIRIDSLRTVDPEDADTLVDAKDVRSEPEEADTLVHRRTLSHA